MVVEDVYIHLSLSPLDTGAEYSPYITLAWRRAGLNMLSQYRGP